MENTAHPKRKSFDLASCSRPRTVEVKTPRVSALIPSSEAVPAPSNEVVNKLGTAKLLMGFDIETNDFLDGRKPYCVGRFGHGCWCHHGDLQFRLVQLGWFTCFAESDIDVKARKERLVIPDGYDISQKATNKHGITTEHAAQHGLAIPQVLEEFMSTAWSVHEAGGVLVSHHLEFDSGIIDEELKRCHLEAWRPRWQTMASQGICTLDLDIQEWLQTSFGKPQTAGEKTLVMSLKDSIRLFYANDANVRSLLQKAHTAAADAELHVMLLHALRGLAKRATSSSAQL